MARVPLPVLLVALILVAALWLLSVQFYTGCEDGCSRAREHIGSLRFPLAAVGLGLVLLAGVRTLSRLRRE